MNAPAFSHWLICGSSQTGKSTMMHRLSRESRRQQVIYDPTYAPKDDAAKNIRGFWRHDLANFVEKINPLVESPRTTTICRTEPDFIFTAEYARDADLFIDEAQDIFAQTKRENFWLMTRGRHQGLRLHIASQRPKLIAPSVRGQVAVIICYRLAHDDLRDTMASAGLSIKRLPREYFPRKAGEYLRADLTDARLRFIHENKDGDILREQELQWIC